MKQPYPSATAERIIVRLPDGMRSRLATIAKANKRSVNAEVVARLELSFINEIEGINPSMEGLHRASLETAIRALQGLLNVATSGERDADSHS